MSFWFFLAVIIGLLVAEGLINNALTVWRDVEKVRASRPGCSCCPKADHQTETE